MLCIALYDSSHSKHQVIQISADFSENAAQILLGKRWEGWLTLAEIESLLWISILYYYTKDYLSIEQIGLVCLP